MSCLFLCKIIMPSACRRQACLRLLFEEEGLRPPPARGLPLDPDYFEVPFVVAAKFVLRRGHQYLKTIRLSFRREHSLELLSHQQQVNAAAPNGYIGKFTRLCPMGNAMQCTNSNILFIHIPMPPMKELFRK